MTEPIFELVPNLSEGRSAKTIEEARDAIEGCGAKVLHSTSDAMHNRSVITAAGSAAAVLDAAVALVGVACERIDLRRHSGVHPRMGALDVLPFVPLLGATMAQAADLAHEAGRRIWEAHRVPSFYYGEAALDPQRRLLADVRPHPAGGPDTGDAFHPTAGAIAIGARGVLIAFNIELETTDLQAGRRIARLIRERNGGLRTLRALAFALADGCVQLSFNITDERATPLYRVVQVARTLARDHGIAVRGCELVGCIPRAAVVSAALYGLGVEDPSI
ncbi:MAG: glutamate formimidoyltransferase [Candidatus Tyrphobacter sp.]